MGDRVLVVDDEPPILITLELAFEESGLTLEAAATYEEALERLAKVAVAAVLVDKNLPGRSGIDLIRWIRERNRSVPIVVMTGYSSAESAKEALNLGVDSYIEKPFPSVMEVPQLLGELIRTGRAGWLPGQAAIPLPPPVSGSQAKRILLATDDRNGSVFGDPLSDFAPPGSRVELYSTASDLLSALEKSPRPDLVIVDAQHFSELVATVEAIRETSQFVSIAVVTATAPNLGVLQELILLGVTQLLDRQPDLYQMQIRRIVKSL